MSAKTDFILGMVFMSFLILLFLTIGNLSLYLFFLTIFKETLVTNMDLQQTLLNCVIFCLFIIDTSIIIKVFNDFKEMYKLRMSEIKDNKNVYSSLSNDGYTDYFSFGNSFDCSNDCGCGGD